MTTIIVVFCIAMAVSFLATPGARRFAFLCGLLDRPNARKVHTRPIPRIGGVAIAGAFFAALIVITTFDTKISLLLRFGRQEILIITGLLIAFGVGFIDDCLRVGYKTKFIMQIAAASIAFAGGLRITSAWFIPVVFDCAVVQYGATVFWFLLFINAINLIDGLDGLAAGICLFVSFVMMLVAMSAGDFYTALFFAALAGALLGFLPFNFHPASIFMGDGGSYFLGYVLAAMGIMGSYKTQMSATILIPLVALGVPIFDVILSPIRRFLRARAPFNPDKSHIHHRLIALGLTARMAVLVCYVITCGLCLFAIIMVNFYNEFGGLLLIILGAVTVVFTKRLGYGDFITVRALRNWMNEISYTVGINRQRRKLIDYQMSTDAAISDGDVLEHFGSFLEDLDFDHADYYRSDYTFDGGKTPQVSPSSQDLNHRTTPIGEASVTLRRRQPQWSWDNPARAVAGQRFSHSLLRVEVPLINDMGEHFGTLLVVKDMKRGGFERHSLRRIDMMCQTVTRTMDRLQKAEIGHS